MPNIKSAKKRVLTSERNRLRNHAFKSSIRTAIRRVHEALAGKTPAADLAATVSKVNSLIDRAILKGILHKNTGSRYKSRVAKFVAKHTAA